jgi:octaprenyl-diphosphate synthase
LHRNAIATATAREIFELVRDDLARVEQEIAAQSRTGIEPVREIGDHLLTGGGKRLRPALLLLSARYCGYRGESAVRLGAVVELIHTATLIHDDVIDGADTRRGRPSANSRWGNHMSVLAGDWLYMQSFQMALRERNFRILDILIELTQNMVEGELIQLTRLGRIDLTEEEALELSYRKTACLFRGCMMLGAVLAGRDAATESALAEYGRSVGLAFQLIDDLLDFTASPEQLGKPVLSDLKEGKVTFPLIYALRHGEPRWREMVATVLAEKGFRSVSPGQIAEMVRESGALEHSRERAREYARRAKASLDGAGDPEFRRALLAIPDFILERES